MARATLVVPSPELQAIVALPVSSSTTRGDWLRVSELETGAVAKLPPAGRNAP
jgi:hypothetical protein